MLTTSSFTHSSYTAAYKMISGRRQSLGVNHLVRVGVICSVLLTNLVASQDCSPERYNNCTAPFSANDLNDAVVPWYSKAVVTEVCKRYQTYVTCMRTVIPYCDTKQALLYKGLVDGYQYLCNSGFDDYVVYQPCFSDPDVQSETMSCSDGLSSKILAINSTDQVYIRKRICQYSDNYMSCVYNALTSFCAVGAAKWQQTFELKQLCPLLTQLACSEWSSQCSALNSGNGVTATTLVPYSSSTLPNWLVIVLGITISFTAVLVFVAVVAVVVARIRISKRYSRRSSSSTMPVRGVNPRIGLELPPPYSGPFPQTLFVAPTAPETPLEAAAGGAANDAFVPPEENSNDVKKFAPFSPPASQETAFRPIDQSAGHFVPDAVQFNDQTSDVIPVSLLPPALQRTVQRQNQSSSDADTWDSTSSMPLPPAARKLNISSRPLSPSHGRDTLASPTLSEASNKFSVDPFFRAASPSSGSAFTGGSVDSGHGRMLPHHGVGSRSPSSTSPTSGVVTNPLVLHQQQQQQLPFSLQNPAPFPPFHMAMAGGAAGGRQDNDVVSPTAASSASAGETMTFSDSLDYY